jgi:phage-related baseplate assembly protein
VQYGFLRKSQNLDTTGGGDDIENDDRLTYRYLTERTRHNTAGSREAYVFWVRQFRGDIGTVAAYRNDENKRPLRDDLYIRAPQDEYYSIEMEYTILTRDANRAGSIQEAVREAVREYIRQQTRIGACINPDELVNLVIGAGAHRCPVISPQWRMIPHDHIARLDGEPVVRFGVGGQVKSKILLAFFWEMCYALFGAGVAAAGNLRPQRG